MSNIRARIHQRSEKEMAELGRKCISLRDKHDVSMKHIAKRFGVTYNAIARWIAKAEEIQLSE